MQKPTQQKVTSSMLSAALMGAVLAATPSLRAEQAVLITEEEQVMGWKALFDGKTLNGIHSWKTRAPLKAGAWTVKDGVLTLAAKSDGGDIYFPASLAESYELELEWMSEGNSGIFLRVDPKAEGHIWANALEMQIMNDTDDDLTKQSAGALFDLIKMWKGNKQINSDGWNKVRITCHNNEFTHYLNDKILYRYTVGDKIWFEERLAESKFKENLDFGMFSRGVIGLQDHGDKVSFRNIKFRELKGEEALNQGQKVRAEVFAQRGPVLANVLAGKDDAYDVNRAYYVNLLEGASEVGAVFNADTLQLSGAWTDTNCAALHGLPYLEGHGETPSWDEKKALFAAKNRPGWANADGSFEDPRASDGKEPRLGGLPSDWAKFKGYYVHGQQVVFSYSVGEADVLDSPSVVQVGEEKAIVRSLELSGLTKEKVLYLADLSEEAEYLKEGKIVKVGGRTFALHATSKSKFLVNEGRLFLAISPDKGADRQFVNVAVWSGKSSAELVFSAAKVLKPLHFLTKGGPSRFKTDKPIVRKGKLSKKKAPYVTDRLILPHDNPFGLSIRVGAFDFYPDGKSAAFTTWDGDLWRVTGTTGNLENLEYQLLATGLHEPLGLKIVGQDIYTLGNDQITLHRDLNGDGETDFFETFNNAWPINKGFHVFTFDLNTDANGDFWFAQGSPVRAGGRGFERVAQYNGSVLKVSKDGKELSQFASGLRAPNGIGIGPNGEVTAADNEGSFMPRCPIHWVTEGYFGGVVDTYANKKALKTVAWGVEGHAHDASEMPKPLVWLPRDVDNSGGSQIWVDSNKWGFPKGQLLHSSYGTSSLYTVFRDSVNGQVQGGVVQVPTRLSSSAMRMRFNPADGQLFIGGLKGWQTNAAELGGIDRIRYTGETLHTLTHVKATKKGLLLSFNFELDSELAEDPESYAITAANIKWSREYGTKEYLIDGSDKEGWSTFEVAKAELLEDGKSVFLSIPDIQPVHELKLEIDVETADGDEVIFPAWMTIHALSE